MSNGKPANTRDRQEFPGLKEEIGEDPARYLDRDLITPEAVRIDTKRKSDGSVDEVRVIQDRNVSTGMALVDARIRGIDQIEVCRAWMAVERALGRGPDGGPREKIIQRLENREQQLEAIGERPDRLEHGPRLPPEWTTVESNVEFVDQPDGEQATMASTSSRHQTRSDVATDGGQDE